MPTFAMLFPGQGSQYIGMLSSFFYSDNIFQNTFDEASHIIGINLLNLIKKNSPKEINKNQYIQVIILTASVAIYRYWKKKCGKMPELMSGHSLGEYSALVCANSIKFSDAVKIVFLRGLLMQKITINRPSSMYSIHGLDEKIIEKICSISSYDKIVSLSCINSNDQIIISGDQKAVEIACVYCKKKGAKSIFKLNINIPAHCELMKPICTRFTKILKNIPIYKPMIPVINNVDMKSETIDINIKNALIKQLYSPVRWKSIIDLILSKNIFFMLEIGPNKILTNLNKKNKKITALHTDTLNDFIISFQQIN
ncbi:ACP S-malonyltransferase [Buchnera aphidicola]|uniref:ACP S-malonyltransferase n=1 Tax=Buchnera aphidicola TaxID=9 RepID=UPI003BEF060B